MCGSTFGKRATGRPLDKLIRGRREAEPKSLQEINFHRTDASLNLLNC